jgi:hypothetical protein
MAATFGWREDYGTQTGSPASGTSLWNPATNVNWSSNADPTTTYSSNPITAGNNSYERYQWGAFSGTYNQILNGLYGHTAGTLGANLTLVGKVTSTYTTPVTTAMSGSTDITTANALPTNALTVLFSTNGNPETATPAASQTANPSATQFLVTQLQTGGSAAAGDTATVTMTLRYDEN